MKQVEIQATFQYGASDSMDAIEGHIQVVKGWVWNSDGVRIKDFVKIEKTPDFGMRYDLTYVFIVKATTFEQAIEEFRKMTTRGKIDYIKEIIVQEEQ